jgi:hypothetical protein
MSDKDGHTVQMRHEIGDAIRSVWDIHARSQNEAIVSQRRKAMITSLLDEASKLLRTAGDGELAAVITALTRAYDSGDLSILSREGTMTSVAQSAMPDDGGVERRATVKVIARCFSTERDGPGLRRLVPSIVKLVLYAGSDAPHVLGPPHPDHLERIITECMMVRAREGSLDQTPRQYVLAFLRGWGVSATEAKDWTKGLL